MSLAPLLAAAISLAGALPPIARADDKSDREALEKSIKKLIKDFDEDAFDTRQGASDAIEKIGVQALPALREARLWSKDPEVIYRAGQAERKILKKVEADPTVPDRVIDGAEDLAKRLSDSAAALKGKPSAQWLAAHRKLLADIDALQDPLAGGVGFAEAHARYKALNELLDAGKEVENGQGNWRALGFLSSAALNGRLTLARAYGLSDDPEHKKQALAVLAEIARMAPEFCTEASTSITPEGARTSESFLRVANRLGAREDADFVKSLHPDHKDEIMEYIRLADWYDK